MFLNTVISTKSSMAVFIAFIKKNSEIGDQCTNEALWEVWIIKHATTTEPQNKHTSILNNNISYPHN